MSSWGGLSTSLSSVFGSLTASAHRQPGIVLEAVEDGDEGRFSGELSEESGGQYELWVVC